MTWDCSTHGSWPPCQLQLNAFEPVIAHVLLAEIAKAALSGAGDVRSLVLATGVLSEEDLHGLLRPERPAGLPVATNQQ